MLLQHVERELGTIGQRIEVGHRSDARIDRSHGDFERSQTCLHPLEKSLQTVKPAAESFKCGNDFRVGHFNL